MISLGSSRFYKKPIVNRFYKIFLAMIIVWLAVPCSLAASEILSSNASLLTVQEAVRRGLSRPAVKQSIEGWISVARSEVAQAALWSNPQFNED